ncbi:tripartite tricarboxylate transporter TctB family protein [Bosea sp. NPDC003192]|jgi:hypothetical protein|uniref:tripartite tricarboxylate transporter TctB family protein n=1 Tax=Bosea sp. NPDC003192 TaxID=3390551 RepID=UPI003CFEE96B
MSPLNDSDAGAASSPAEPAPASGANDILLGLLFAAIGALALYVGRNYVFGTTQRMGPGFLPRIVSGALVLIGIALMLRGMLTRGWAPPAIAWRPILLICLAVIVFSSTIDRLGLFVASLLTVGIGACAGQEIRWKELPLIALGLAAFCTVLFGYVLKISMPVWPQ